MAASTPLFDMSTYPCVFIVDDDPAVRDAIGLLIEAFGFAYQTFDSAEHFLKSYWPGKRGCLLLDVNLPGMNGFELQSELVRRLINLPIIFLTAQSNSLLKDRAIQLGAVDFFSKPVPIKLLIERIQSVLKHEAYQ